MSGEISGGTESVNYAPDWPKQSHKIVAGIFLTAWTNQGPRSWIMSLQKFRLTSLFFAWEILPGSVFKVLFYSQREKKLFAGKHQVDTEKINP